MPCTRCPRPTTSADGLCVLCRLRLMALERQAALPVDGKTRAAGD